MRENRDFYENNGYIDSMDLGMVTTYHIERDASGLSENMGEYKSIQIQFANRNSVLD